MTNTNLPDHWTPTELVGAPAYLQRAAKDYAEAYALSALSAQSEQSGQGDVFGYLSPQHDAGGNYSFETYYMHGAVCRPGWFPVYTRHQPAQPSEAQPTRAVTHEQLTDLIAEKLSGMYHCTRVWDAWNVGTMSQDDFEDVGESDTPSELAQEVLDLLSTPTAAPTFDATAKCSPTLTQCPRCNNPHSVCDQGAAPAQQQAGAVEVSDAEKPLPHGYLLARVAMIVPLLEEARDALTAITEPQRLWNGISPSLGDRMDEAGTFSLDDWRALKAGGVA